MRGESSQRKSKGRSIEISNSRAMGVVVLIALLFVFQVATFVFQKIRGAGASDVAEDAKPAQQRFRFNPNTITLDSLQLLGFTQRQAQTILNYRSKGGKFRRREDFARMYTVDSAMYASLEGYIFIPDKDSVAGKNSPVRKRGAPGTGNASAEKLVSKEGVSGTGSPTVGRKVRENGNNGTGMNGGGKTGAIYGGKVERNRYVCNLNTADSAALVELYGIGGHFARKILEYRERLGGSFVDKRQLMEIDGFGRERYERIEGYVIVDGRDVKGFSLLGADRRALERHPYIGPYAARGILTYIRIRGKGTFADELQLLEELVKEHVLTENNALRLREYLLHL
ncbi:MAG: helix-hairpin-helix domain-containing protein, partial [Bacteroidales bacterium]|nr:helix-hairpin-helix domain-containing protein [Bacteroidales bacterium]